MTEFRGKDEGLKLRQKKNANKRKKAKVLDDLKPGDVVWVRIRIKIGLDMRRNKEVHQTHTR